MSAWVRDRTCSLVAVGAITAYDPQCDPDRRALPLAAALAAVIARAEE